MKKELLALALIALLPACGCLRKKTKTEAPKKAKSAKMKEEHKGAMHHDKAMKKHEPMKKGATSAKTHMDMHGAY